MKTLYGLVSVATVAAAMASSGSARAEGTEGSATAEAHVGADVHPGESKEAEEKEEKGVAGVDLVFGWGNTATAVPDPLPSDGSPPTYSRDESVKTSVRSFILGGEVEIIEDVVVGLRVPFSFATFSPEGGSRSTMAFGNTELEGGYEHELSEQLKLVGALGFALPTGQGDEIPDDLRVQNAHSTDVAAYDKFALNHAAAAARGYEDNALFEAHRFGVIPKLALEYKSHGLSVAPYVKVENLIATTTLAHGYVGELVPAVRAGYRVMPQLEPALRIWANVGFAGGDEDKKTTFALEPQLVAHLGAIRPYAGLVLPVAGPPSDAGFGTSLRLGAMGVF